MKQILNFLANEGDFLWRQRGFKMVDSKYDGMNRAMVALSNGKLVVCLWTDRQDPMGISIVAAEDYGDHHFYTWQIIRERLTGQRVNSREEYHQELSTEDLDLFRRRLPEIQEWFEPGNRSTSYEQLDQMFEAMIKRLNANKK